MKLDEHMKLLTSQKNVLAEKITDFGMTIVDFIFEESPEYVIICAKKDEELYFQFRPTIQGADFCDIYYRPTNKSSRKSLYMSINTFEEGIHYFQEWLECLKEEIYVENKWKQ